MAEAESVEQGEAGIADRGLDFAAAGPCWDQAHQAGCSRLSQSVQVSLLPPKRASRVTVRRMDRCRARGMMMRLG